MYHTIVYYTICSTVYVLHYMHYTHLVDINVRNLLLERVCMCVYVYGCGL
jgi:hypothetical protein